MMMLPTIVSVRGIIFTSLLVMGAGVFVIFQNSKDKADYRKSSGTIEYYDKAFQHLPVRHKGDYRYLKIDSYPHVFEIYVPNSKPTDKAMDDLTIGNKVDIYYYETDNTRTSGINKFTQFLDKDGRPYFIRNGFQKQLGMVIIVLAILLNIMAFVFWKMRKLPW